MFTRKDLEDCETKNLASGAVKSRFSRGRGTSEKEHPYRSVYQRDRDRIVHSAAFRRLEYKTQVFVYHEGDYYRTRLTHTLEVAQISRVISRALRLNEELTEAIALAHDLGHTPFGHAVEEVLDEFTRAEAGFNHNAQSLRVVDRLEQRYPSFGGLNLSWETREGIIKHAGGGALSFIEPHPEFDPQSQPSLEAQVMDVADEIAYDNHDIDDGLKSGMIEEDELKRLSLWKETSRKVKKSYCGVTREQRLFLIIREMINQEVTDLINNTSHNLRRCGLKDQEAVHQCPQRLSVFSPAMQQQREELRRSIYRRLYCNWRVLRMSDKARRFTKSLFHVYTGDPQLMPPSFRRGEPAATSVKRSACDYIAGMTDRYALEEYRKLFDPYEKV
jgi:dGTPase